MSEPGQRRERLEDLAFECLDRMQREGAGALDRVCDAYPDHAAELRDIVRRLEHSGMVDSEPDRDVRDADWPREFGEFRLLRRLGSGGMGIVWLADQPAMGRRVALKLMHPGIHADDRARERFRREVHALSKLDHPGICAVFEAGEVERTPFIAMRYVEGRSVSEICEERRRERDAQDRPRQTPTSSSERDDWLRLVEKVARAAHSAHEAGVVHRDIKPANIIVDADGDPVLVDFGLARDAGNAQRALTTAGHPIGTPAYMAPEQITGGRPIDRRTDVYGLGALLYEVLTLRPPFDDETREKLYHRIIEEPPPNPRRLGVPVELCAVLDRALQKRRRDRFASALEFADELARFVRREPVHTRRAGPLLRARRWCQRNRAAAAALTVVTLALGVTSWSLARSVRAESHLRELAILDEAERVLGSDPWLAARIAREAIDSEQSNVIARLQRILFELPDQRTVRTGGPFHWTDFSADGSRFFVHGASRRPSVHRGVDGAELLVVPEVIENQCPPLALAADGSRVAVGVQGRVHVYEVAGPAREPSWAVDHAALHGEPGRIERKVLGLAFRAGDGALGVTDWRGDASLWSADAMRGTALIDPNASNLWFPRFLPSGRLIAAGGVWSRDGDALTEIDAPGHWVGWVGAFHRGFITGAHQDRLRAWSHDGSLLGDLAGPMGEGAFATLRSVDVCAEVERAVVGYGNGHVSCIDLETGSSLDWSASESAVDVALAAGGQRIVTADWMGRLALWDVDGRLIRRVSAHREGIFHLAVLPSDDPGDLRVVTVSDDGTAKLTRLRPLGGLPVVFDVERPSLASRADGSVLVVSNGVVAHYGHDGALLARARLALEAPSSGAWADSTSTPATATVFPSRDGSVWEWIPGAGGPPRLLGQLERKLVSAAPLVGGRILLQSHRPVHLSVWTPDTGEETVLEVHRESRDLVVDVADDRTRFGVGSDVAVHVFEQERELWRCEIDEPKTALALSHDGRLIALPRSGGRIQVRNWTTDQLVADRVVHESRITALEFGAGDATLASSSADGTVRVWEFRSGREPRVVARTDAALLDVAWAGPDRVVTAGRDDTLRWWWLDRNRLRSVIDELEVGTLSTAERRRFPHLFER